MITYYKEWSIVYADHAIHDYITETTKQATARPNIDFLGQGSIEGDSNCI